MCRQMFTNKDTDIKMLAKMFTYEEGLEIVGLQA